MNPSDASPTIPRSDEPPGRGPPGGPGSGGGRADGFGEQPGDEIGPYRLLKVLGEGGFGVVWLAERRVPMVQRVALKIIKPGMDSRDVVARFEQERQALAVMDHPHIAKVFDGGVTGQGRPYFVMEYVAGEAITSYTDRNNLGLRERLALFEHVCDAVQHAHMKGIIHRDIKPSNILVSVSDGPPLAKVIDFGVAKAVSHTLTDKTIFTQTGQLVGTPEYMSPEQAEAGALDIDTRTDVYSLGVVLYELLTGGVPFESKVLRSKGYAEIQRIIRDTEPPKPSTRFTEMGAAAAAVARHRQLRVDELTRQLRSELEWIPLRAMQKDRTRRYQTARELGEDIARYLRGEALVAGPESAAYRLKKFMRRHKGPVLAAGAVAGALVLGLAFTLWQADRAARERDAAVEARRATERALERAQAVITFVQRALVSSDASLGGGADVTVGEVLTQAVQEVDAGALAKQPDVEASMRALLGRVLLDLGRAEESEPVLRRALEARRALAGGPQAESADVAWSLNDLAEALLARGRVAEAIAMHEDALAMRQRLHAGDDADTAQSLNNLGGALLRAGKFGDAEARLNAAAAVRARLFAGDHEDVAVTLANLGALRLAQGKPADAEPLLSRALEMRERLGRRPDQVAAGLVSLAVVRRNLGRNEDAASLLERGIALAARLYGPEHPLTIKALDARASVLHAMGRDAEAEAAFDQVQAAMVARPNQNDPAQAAYTFNHATFLHDLKRYADALPYYQNALDARRRLAAGADSGDVAASLTGLASVLLDMGQVERAATAAEESAAMLGRLFPDGHPRRALAMSTLALVLSAQGKKDEARAMVQQAVEMVLKFQPENGPHAVRVLAARRAVEGR